MHKKVDKEKPHLRNKSKTMDLPDMYKLDYNSLINYDYGFITGHSKDIKNELIDYASSNIRRARATVQLNEILYDIDLSIKIELGVFEFALIHTSMNNMLDEFVVPTYHNKLHSIIVNINCDKHINNKTLKHGLLTGEINPQALAFFSPEQLHPEKWAVQLKKKQVREERENNMPTTDIYKCYKCGERKCRVAEAQTRSADEPSTKFITCLVCYNTFTKS